MDKDEQKPINKPKEEKPNMNITPPKFGDKKGGLIRNRTNDDKVDNQIDEQLKHLFDDE
jgi:hypothetical protein